MEYDKMGWPGTLKLPPEVPIIEIPSRTDAGEVCPERSRQTYDAAMVFG